MAQVIKRELVDDLDGSKAEETVTFGVDNVAYEIDLSRDHAGELRDELARYLAKSRKLGRFNVGAAAGTVRRGASSNGAGNNREQNQAIRDWARQQGLPVSERGRISAEVQQQFDTAHQAASPVPDAVAPAYHEIRGWA